ncbi:MAG: TRL-like protein family [Chlorobiales bacterium]|nr:TRL-like protein family [Chlorobiales bacterium]
MKKVLRVVFACATLFYMSGCATPYPMGVVYSEFKVPAAVTSNNGTTTKVGTAECETYFGLIATGDASIEAAKKSVGITKVYHVDWQVKNILGVIGKYKVVVYGE